MKTFFTYLALLCAVLAAPTAASGALGLGVVDDSPKGSVDGGAAFYALMADLGMTENRVTVAWDPERPDPAAEDAFFTSILPTAQARGIRVIFAVYPAKARSITNSPNAPGQFAAYLQHLARTHPYVTDYIVGNEPNQTRFWQPQFDARGRGAACAAYESLLAASYDALKGVNPGINVIGVGLSPRGNDNPRVRSNVSTSPVRCIRDMGRAFRISKRKRPIMDAFRGTAQPTFPEGRSARGLRFRLDEVGWQVGVLPGLESHYVGQETVETTSEAAQAQVYASLIPYLAC